jgi:ribosomal-protein-alanine N-acetyltransferase
MPDTGETISHDLVQDKKDTHNLVLRARGVVLRPFRIGDVNETYCRWLHDPEVIRFLEVRYSDRSPEALKAQVERFLSNTNLYFFLIETAPEGIPVGTASVVVRPRYNVATFGYMMGERSQWGGDRTVAVQVALLDFAFDTLGLRRLEGGAPATNASSHFNFRRLGFVREGVRRRQLIDERTGPVDRIVYGMLSEEWQVARSKYDRFRTRPA